MGFQLIILSKSKERSDSISDLATSIDSEIVVHKSINIDQAITKVKEEDPKLFFSDDSFGFDSSLRLLNYSSENNFNPHNYFVFITEDADFDKIKEIINFGFDDYMMGHNNKEVLLNRIRVGKRNLELRFKLLTEKEKYLELSNELANHLDDIFKLSSNFIETRIPASNNMMQKIAKQVEITAIKLGDFDEDKIKDLKIAAYLSQSGRLHLPDKFLNKPVMKDGRVSDDIMYQVPSISKSILADFPRYQNASNIIYHIWENFDGTGIPSKIQKWQIPLESRIIRVVLDYEELRFFRNYSRAQAITEIQNRSNKLYDPRIVNAFVTIIKEIIGDEDSNIDFVMIPELKPGMKIMSDIHTSSGLKMLGVGTVLTEKTIDYLIKYSVNDPIIGSIQIDKAFFQNQS